MQTKKSSPQRPELKKSNSKPQIMSPQKTIPSRFSPVKNCKVSKGPSKDYFSYTPLRHNKSVTCSTPELKTNRSMRKETPEAVTQRKVILEQGKLLQEKLREFKCKIQANSVSAFTSRSSFSQVSVFCKVIDKKVRKRQRKLVLEGFRVLFQIFLQDVVRPRKFFEGKLKLRVFKGLKQVEELMKHASRHYRLQLLVKTFLKWNEVCVWNKSSSVTNDSNQSYFKDHMSTASVSDSFTDLSLVSDSLYNSSVKCNFGLTPWKHFVQVNKRRKALRALATENFECKLKLKGFSALFKLYQVNVIRPKQFRKIVKQQQVYSVLKKYQHFSERQESVVEKFRRVSSI